MRHYVDVTDADFERAATGGGVPDSKAAQSVRVRSGNESQAEGSAQEKTPVLQGFATGCEAVQPGRVPRRGLGQSADFPRRVRVSETTGAKSGAVDRENAPFDLNLATVIDVWQSAPAPA